MNQSEEIQFYEIWGAVAQMTMNQNLTDAAMKLAFNILSAYELEDISNAVHAHLRDPENGKWMPKPADIIQKMNGTLPKPAEIVGLARANNSPLGCFARMIIGKWDLDNQDSFYLNQRAEEVKAKLPEFIARARKGEYTNGEIALMKSQNVEFDSPLCPGLPGPKTKIVKGIVERAKTIPSHVPANIQNPKDTPDAALPLIQMINESKGESHDNAIR